jgi:hypothetical protein
VASWVATRVGGRRRRRWWASAARLDQDRWQRPAGDARSISSPMTAAGEGKRGESGSATHWRETDGDGDAGHECSPVGMHAASPPRRDLAHQAATSRLSLVASRAAVRPLPRVQRSVVSDPEGATRGTELTVGVGLRNEADDVSFPAQSKTNNNFLVPLI